MDKPFGNLIEGLSAVGWVVVPEFWPIPLVNSLRKLCEQLINDGELKPAGVGRADAHRLDARVRGDRISWLDAYQSEPCVAEYLAITTAMREALNAHAFLGLVDYESHFAAYAPGAFYKKHLDRFSDNDQRTVSSVSYLNPDWQAQDGGELVIYAADSQQTLARVLPQAGTLVCFMSAEIPHEVLPAMRERYSIAGWFRVRAWAP